MNIPRAKIKKVFYVIAPDFTIRSFIELNDNLDNKQHKVCNYFTSERQAREFASKIKNYIIELWKEELKNGN